MRDATIPTHALVPALVSQHDGLRRPPGGKDGDGVCRCALDLLPLAVEAAERPGQLHGARAASWVRNSSVATCTPPMRPAALTAAARAYSRSSPRDDGALLHGAFGHQRGDADALWPAPAGRGRPSRFSPVSGMTSATVPRHRKSQYWSSSFSWSPLDGGGQLERDADARHLRDRLGAGLAVRVDERRGLRQLGLHSWWSVMTRSMPSSLQPLRLLIGRDTAVDRHDQLHALLFERVDGEQVEPSQPSSSRARGYSWSRGRPCCADIPSAGRWP